MKAAKALVPVVIGLLFQVLSATGVVVPGDVQAGILSAVTSILVWWMPNNNG